MAIKVQGDVIIKDDGGVQASSLKVDGLEYPKAAGTEGQVLTSGSSGTIDFENAPSVEAGAGINVSKSADNVYTVTSDVIGLLDYEGSVDLTSDTVPDTSSMQEGTSFVNSGDGTISSAWQGVTSENITNQVKPLDTVVWNTTDSKFDYYPNTDIPPVDLGYTPAADGGTITNTGGTAASIPMANGTTAGLSLNDYSKEEKDKLDSVSVKIDLYPDDPSSLGASTLQEVTDKGSHTTNGITLGGDNAAAAKIQLNADGSATFAGKITAASTEDSDGGNVVVTKDYLGSAGSGGTGALGYWTRTGTNLSPVNASDNVGIGLNNPAYALDVASSDSATGYAARLRANDTAGLCGIQFTSSTNPVTLYANIFGNSDQSLSFGTGGGGSEKMRIDANGKVGIGTDTPSSDLQVGTYDSSGVRFYKTGYTQVRDDNGSGGFECYKDGSGSTNRTVRITTAGNGYFSGNVGIGTDNPRSPLHVFGANSINVIADFSAPPSDPVGAVPATILIQGRKRCWRLVTTSDATGLPERRYQYN